MEILESRLDLAGYGILSILTGRTKMPDETPSASINRELAAKITAAYVRRNQIGSDQLGTLISTVHQAFSGLGKPAAAARALELPRCRSGDPFSMITSSAWNADGGA